MKQKDQWAEDYLNSIEGMDIYYGHRRAGFMAGFELARKEAALTSNFNGPCSLTHCDCQKVITEAIQIIGEKETGSEPVAKDEK